MNVQPVNLINNINSTKNKQQKANFGGFSSEIEINEQFRKTFYRLAKKESKHLTLEDLESKYSSLISTLKTLESEFVNNKNVNLHISQKGLKNYIYAFVKSPNPRINLALNISPYYGYTYRKSLTNAKEILPDIHKSSARIEANT